MNEKKEKTMRKVLQEGTWIRLSQGELYKITVKKYLILMGKLQSVKLTMR